MARSFLEKVEELTLHATELGRQNEKPRRDNLALVQPDWPKACLVP